MSRSTAVSIFEDDVPTKRQSGTLYVVRDLAHETVRVLDGWADDRLLISDMEERHAALAAKSISASCKDCIAVLETWFANPPAQEDRRRLIDRVLALRDHAQQLLARHGVHL